MTTVTVQALQKFGVTSDGKARLKRKAVLQTDIEGVDVKCRGRLFQVWVAAIGKAGSPTVDSRVRQTMSNDEEVKHSRLQASKSAEHWERGRKRGKGKGGKIRSLDP